MKEDRRISLCLTTRNRVDMTIEAFIRVYEDPRIDEIVISDDASDLVNFINLCDFKHNYFPKKIVIDHNDECIGMQANKAKVLSLAKNDWCILLDSDNKIDHTYLNALYSIITWESDTIYCPSFAQPDFNYTMFEGINFGREEMGILMQDSKTPKLLNTCNYFVNRHQYAKVYQYDPTIKAADTIFHAYNHLKAGGRFQVVKDLHYFHLVHEGSGWRKDLKENRERSKEIERLIMEL